MPEHETDDRRSLQLRQRQLTGLLLLAFLVAILTLLRASHGSIFPPGWWRW